METSKMNLKKVCRICLKNYKKLFDLFEAEVPKMLSFCGFLKVVEGDGYPDKICKGCNDMLAQSYELKHLCLNSDSYLRSLDVDDGNILETSSKNKCNTANSNLICERLQSPGEELSENESVEEIALLYTCSKFQTSFSSKELFSEQDCNKLLDDKGSKPGSDCETNNPVVQEENDLDTICESKADDNKDVPYFCPQCKAKFDHKQDVLVHQSVHSKEGLICNVCQKICDTMKVLKRHIKTHMIAKSHICRICDKGFSESTALLKHTKLHHLQVPRDKKYVCDECGQRFTDKYYLDLHQRKHTGEKPFKCNVCNKCFYDPRSFKVHMDVHSGKKPYLCSHCGKSFVQSSHLRQHSLVHTKEKPYSCNICNKRFTQSTSLQRHQKLRPGRFYCCICLKSFKDEERFIKHRKSHCNKNKTIKAKDKKETDTENNSTCA